MADCVSSLKHYWSHYTFLTLHHSNSPSNNKQCKSDIMQCNCCCMQILSYDFCVHNWRNLDEDMIMPLCKNMWCHDNSTVTSSKIVASKLTYIYYSYHGNKASTHILSQYIISCKSVKVRYTKNYLSQKQKNNLPNSLILSIDSFLLLHITDHFPNTT